LADQDLGQGAAVGQIAEIFGDGGDVLGQLRQDGLGIAEALKVTRLDQAGRLVGRGTTGAFRVDVDLPADTGVLKLLEDQL
jgi:hypothetical protein